jgi:hypothetical protein
VCVHHQTPLSQSHVNLLDEVLGRKVITAIHHHIPRMLIVKAPAEYVVRRGRGEFVLVPSHLDVRIELRYALLGRLALGHAHGRHGMNNLALQIGRVDSIAIDDTNTANTGGCQVQERGRAQTTSSNHQYRRVAQRFLASYTDRVQDQVSRVASNFLVRQACRGRGLGRTGCADRCWSCGLRPRILSIGIGVSSRSSLSGHGPFRSPRWPELDI